MPLCVYGLEEIGGRHASSDSSIHLFFSRILVSPFGRSRLSREKRVENERLKDEKEKSREEFFGGRHDAYVTRRCLYFAFPLQPSRATRESCDLYFLFDTFLRDARKTTNLSSKRLSTIR